MKKIIFLFNITFIFFITGCTLYQKPKVPCVPTPACFEVKIPSHCSKLNKEWWKNFEDPQLNELVDLALKNNYNYQIALKNIQIACTYISQNISNLFPQVNSDASATRNKVSQAVGSTTAGTELGPFDLYHLGASVSYEVDIWNQIRNSVKQAQSDTAATCANSNIVKLSLIANIVSTYFQLVNLNANLVNLNTQLKCADEIVSITNTQFISGLVDGLSLDAAKNQREAIKSTLASSIKQQQILKFTLAYLIGTYPECFNFKIPDVLVFKHIENYVPPAMPACMIASRPDIQQAYYQILSYGYIEKQTIANFLPNITLTGNYGYLSNSLRHLFSKTTQYWNYGIFITQFIFDYQNRLSQYYRAKYQYEASILNYRNVLLNAFNEVNTALISYEADNKILNAYQKQNINFLDSLKITQAQYQSGLADYTVYLSTYLNQQQNMLNITNQQAAILQDVVQIYKTLGLGITPCCQS